ncbi:MULTISPECIES: DUF992 domain-containing protein [unclassified Rhizobium]|jgi:hypothetical protein|nr:MULTISPECIES: DUF992 domain-containing protein [unclassified Rhizobium]MBX5156984.1 DUF992 domain-containing protein [Rhizobium sp. NZLR8]MBX5165263.1 DUF992 domain-containing protein [Rhizobium sp. NZLR4b]MBX5172665.1 DUF992 domain-containing protein [Rhizobium sp. NZLR1b]MBX5185069.1 DUF992 domain-containing protein [Rhizobium sp. NZLR5]MBX5208973.1 DUF992 domain-containing protein [Rhizobium sp. NZLR11]
MNKLMMTAAAATLGVVPSFVPAAEAASQPKQPKHAAQQVVNTPKTRLGTLSCEVAGGVGMVLGSSKAIDCSFKQKTGKVEHYTGTIGKLGLDIGVTGKSYLSWVVVNTAPTRVGDGALAGTYVGASASASVGVGLGANALVGGNAKNYALQPLSGEAGTGLNVAAGVSRLQLKAAR